MTEHPVFPAEDIDSRLAAGLGELLGAERMADVLCLRRAGSTNDELRLLALGGAPAGTVVIAGAQTAGRGRLGRSFLSAAGEGLYLSALLRPDCPAEALPQLTAWAGVAVCRAVERACGVKPGLKWVNDIVLNGRKLGGVLTELSGDGGGGRAAVLGVGINVLQRGFPPELEGVAASLYTESGRDFSISALACSVVRELDALRRDFPGDKAAYLAAYRALCVTTGREVAYTRGGETLRAFAEAVDGDFGLTLRRPDGARETLRSGEVSVRGLYGYT